MGKEIEERSRIEVSECFSLWKPPEASGGPRGTETPGAPPETSGQDANPDRAAAPPFPPEVTRPCAPAPGLPGRLRPTTWFIPLLPGHPSSRTIEHGRFLLNDVFLLPWASTGPLLAPRSSKTTQDEEPTSGKGSRGRGPCLEPHAPPSQSHEPCRSHPVRAIGAENVVRVWHCTSASQPGQRERERER